MTDTTLQIKMTLPLVARHTTDVGTRCAEGLFRETQRGGTGSSEPLEANSLRI